MYFYLIVALQAYCIYHCYSNRYPYYWIFVILFVPLLGSMLYLFMNVIQKRDIDRVQAEITSVVNPTKKIKELEVKIKLTDSFENRVALAEAYLEVKMYKEAIHYFEEALKGTFQNDFYVTSKLQEAYYFSSNYDKSIAVAGRISKHAKFKKSRAAFLYALALERKGELIKAEELLTQLDAPYSKYEERLELAKVYIKNGSLDKARTLLDEIALESDGMSKLSFREYGGWIKKAKELQNSGF